jgi:hypothetical protein
VLFWNKVGARFRAVPRLAAMTTDQRLTVFSLIKVFVPEPSQADIERSFAWLDESRAVAPSTKRRAEASPFDREKEPA